VVRHRGDAADRRAVEEPLHAPQDLLRRETEAFGDGMIGARHERQAALRRNQEAPVDGVEAGPFELGDGHRAAPASSLRRR
jgi:hypothetical protein